MQRVARGQARSGNGLGLDLSAPVIAVSVAIAIIVTGSSWLIGYNPPVADIKYDWLVAREALRPGGDAYGDVLQLAEMEGVSIQINAPVGTEAVSGHPRPPGALLLQTALAGLPYDALFGLAAGVSVLAVGLMISLSRTRTLKMGIGYLVLFLCLGPTAIAIGFSGQAPIVAALALVGWLIASRRDSPWAGILIGVAATLKVFPLVLLFPLIAARKKVTSYVVLGAFAALNLAGLLLPGVTMNRALDELPKATDTWLRLIANGSIIRHLADFGLDGVAAQMTALAAAVMLVFLFRRRVLGGSPPFFWLAVALLVMPLSWISYDVVLYPAVMLMLTSSDERARYLGWFAVGFWVIPVATYPFAIISIGTMALFARAIVLSACLLMPGLFASWGLDPRRRDAPSKMVTEELGGLPFG